MKQYEKPSLTMLELANEMPVICASVPDVSIKPGKAEEGIAPMSCGWNDLPWSEAADNEAEPSSGK